MLLVIIIGKDFDLNMTKRNYIIETKKSEKAIIDIQGKKDRFRFEKTIVFRIWAGQHSQVTVNIIFIYCFFHYVFYYAFIYLLFFLLKVKSQDPIKYNVNSNIDITDGSWLNNTYFSFLFLCCSYIVCMYCI